MKNLLLFLFLSLILLSYTVTKHSLADYVTTDNTIEAIKPIDTCPDQDVWVYVKHSPHDIGDPYVVVVVPIPKRTLVADFENCPAEDTEFLGQGRIAMMGFAGFHVVTVKKGLLNNTNNYTTKAPIDIKVPANNVNAWHVKK